MKPFNMLFAGVGGQGILFASKIFFEAAMVRGQKVMGAETHGMSQRGGSVVSHFKMGDQASSMVIPGTADVLVALESTEGLRNLHFLRPGGVYLVNAKHLAHIPETVITLFEKMDITVYYFDADGHAMALDKPLTSNLYLIGFMASMKSIPFEYEEVKAIVTKLSKTPFLNDNLHAFNVGYEAGKSAS